MCCNASTCLQHATGPRVRNPPAVYVILNHFPQKNGDSRLGFLDISTLGSHKQIGLIFDQFAARVCSQLIHGEVHGLTWQAGTKFHLKCMISYYSRAVFIIAVYIYIYLYYILYFIALYCVVLHCSLLYCIMLCHASYYIQYVCVCYIIMTVYVYYIIFYNIYIYIYYVCVSVCPYRLHEFNLVPIILEMEVTVKKTVVSLFFVHCPFICWFSLAHSVSFTEVPNLRNGRKQKIRRTSNQRISHHGGVRDVLIVVRSQTEGSLPRKSQQPPKKK